MKNLFISIIQNDEQNYNGDLLHYFRCIFNGPNTLNPYHNFFHTMHVMCTSYNAARHIKTNKTNMRALLIAALFHDFGHSGHSQNDKEEIDRAVFNFKNNILEEDKEIFSTIERLIRSTQYPHNKDIKRDELVDIIRDADLSQVLNDHWMQQSIFGLAKELDIDNIVFLKSEIDFLKKLTFKSKWVKKYYEPKIPAKIKEINTLIQLLN